MKGQLFDQLTDIFRGENNTFVSSNTTIMHFITLSLSPLSSLSRFQQNTRRNGRIYGGCNRSLKDQFFYRKRKHSQWYYCVRGCLWVWTQQRLEPLDAHGFIRTLRPKLFDACGATCIEQFRPTSAVVSRVVFLHFFIGNLVGPWEGTVCTCHRSTKYNFP